MSLAREDALYSLKGYGTVRERDRERENSNNAGKTVAKSSESPMIYELKYRTFVTVVEIPNHFHMHNADSQMQTFVSQRLYCSF